MSRFLEVAGLQALGVYEDPDMTTECPREDPELLVQPKTQRYQPPTPI